MRLAMHVILAAAALTVAGCGDENAVGRAIRTTDAGTVIVGATHAKAGLKVEIQNDSLYVQLTDDAPGPTRRLAGKPLGGACKVDGEGGVRVTRQFPIYWREDLGDWGSAVVRHPIGTESPESLAQHVTSCRIFALKPTNAPDQLSFNEATDTPFATVQLR